MSASTAPPVAEPDPALIEELAGKLFATYTGGMVTYMVNLAHRTGLLDTLAAGAGSSAELAARAGLVERYVRECLAALVTGGLIDFDPDTEQYRFTPEQQVCLTGHGSLNLAPYSRIATLLARYVDDVGECFTDGGGVPYEAFRPEFTDVMDSLGRGQYDQHLLTGIVPQLDGLAERLAVGARVADIGCGTGHTTNLLAQAYSASHFVGYDLAGDAIDRARQEAAEYGLDNATFEVRNVLELPVDPPFDVVFAFDAIHDQVDPAGVLRRVNSALVPGGEFIMLDIRAASSLQENRANPFAPWIYAVSTLHCMTVSLADGGAGLGTAWGQQLAMRMLAEAGFVDVEVRDVPDDPFNCLYRARKPA